MVKQPDEFVDLLQGRGFKLLDRDIVDDETLGRSIIVELLWAS